MCGIVGYVGSKPCGNILFDGLKKLEYRGYDSVGIAVNNGGKISIIKKKGRVDTIKEQAENLVGNVGIGHTRWSTHGKPSDENSHPHRSGKFAVVHNGIIENYLELKKQLIKDGYIFLSETDTEVIAHLLSKNYDIGCTFIEAVKKTVSMLKGSYAIAVLCEDYPNNIIVAKKESPLIVGVSDSENFIASDIPALKGYVENICYLKDGEFADVGLEEVKFYDNNLRIINKEKVKIEPDDDNEISGCFESYMIKEIYETPLAIKKTAEFLLDKPLPDRLISVFKKSSRITIIGCGTAYNSGLIGKYIIEKTIRKIVDIDLASEFRYKDPIIDSNSILIAVSQSGETADTISAVKLAKSRGAYIISITNSKFSAITTISDFVVELKAGLEVAVAATKSYNCQLVAFYYLADKLAEICSVTPNYLKKIIDNQYNIEINDNCRKQLTDCAYRLKSYKNVFYLGRGLDYAVAVEASLKLKEISYAHSEGYASGELKHGTLALIEKGTLVVSIITQEKLIDKEMNAILEVKARGAEVIIVTQFESVINTNQADYFIKINEIEDDLMPLISIRPLQLFAYYSAKSKGLDADKPRNLAKSVTVE